MKNTIINYVNPFRIDTSLYWITDGGYIHFEATKELILSSFKEQFLEILTSRLRKAGIECVGIQYYSPRDYNYAGDSLDLQITITDPDKLRNAVEPFAKVVDKYLRANRSYDGYLALTPDTYQDEDFTNPSVILIEELISQLVPEIEESFNISDYFILIK